jgi:hypothetical protein
MVDGGGHNIHFERSLPGKKASSSGRVSLSPLKRGLGVVVVDYWRNGGAERGLWAYNERRSPLVHRELGGQSRSGLVGKAVHCDAELWSQSSRGETS